MDKREQLAELYAKKIISESEYHFTLAVLKALERLEMVDLAAVFGEDEEEKENPYDELDDLVEKLLKEEKTAS